MRPGEGREALAALGEVGGLVGQVRGGRGH